MGRLDGKVVVIAGAAGGIGREAALLFSEEGASICVADVAEEQGEQTAAECREAFFQKVGEPESVEDMYRATAALRRHRRASTTTRIMPADDGLDPRDRPRRLGARPGREHQGRLPLLQVRASPTLERGRGSVINVASFVAPAGAATSQISYTASKGAVLSMSRELAVEFARRGSASTRLPWPGRDAAPHAALR